MSTTLQKHLEYATGYLELRMFEDALAEADLVLQQQPDNELAIAVKSSALWQANRLEEAEPYVARLAELHPREATLWINLAYIRRRTQSLEAAVETLQHAFDANPRDALAHFNMACYRAVQRRREEALLLLRNALYLDPKLRRLAKAEPDLQPLRELPEFWRLVEGRS